MLKEPFDGTLADSERASEMTNPKMRISLKSIFTCFTKKNIKIIDYEFKIF